MARKKRASLSKRTRFEVFKRDGFRCIYCGATPVQKALHVDHVVPVAEGGPDTAENLATSCADCNLGKNAVPLERRALAPAIATEAQQDHAEQIREYLRVQQEIEEARTAAAEHLQMAWERLIGPMSQDMFDRLKRIAQEWPVPELLEAMEITGRKLGSPSAAFSPYHATQQAKYFQGILRRWRQQDEEDLKNSRAYRARLAARDEALGRCAKPDGED